MLGGIAPEKMVKGKPGMVIRNEEDLGHVLREWRRSRNDT
jgi:hypothetical protein